MTKDEFLKMVKTLIDELNKEFKINNINVEYFRRVAPNGEEFKKAQYQQDFVQSKINALSDLVKLPAYARVQAMSEKEREEYIKDKIEELELQVKEIELKEDQAKNELANLKRKQDQLISKFGSVSENGKEKIINEGQPLIYRIRKYEEEDGILARYKKEKDELKNKQDKIKKMTLEEIKQHLSNEIQGSSDLKEEIKKAQVPFDEYSELLASVAPDPEKAQKMAELLSIYEFRSSPYNGKFYNALFEIKDIPDLLRQKLYKNMISFNPKTNELQEPDKVLEIVEDFEKQFKKEKDIFYKQFTIEKLSKLVDIKKSERFGTFESEDKKNNKKNQNVDMNFLQQHADKIGDGKLENLQHKVNLRNNLSKKILKFPTTKDEINNYNDEIKRIQKNIYYDIIRWYKFYSNSFLGLSFSQNNILEFDQSTLGDDLFRSQEALQEILEKCKKDIEKKEKAITAIKKKIPEIKEIWQQSNASYETEKTEIEQKIRDLVGEKYSKTEISSALMTDRENLDKIINAYGKIYKTGIIRQVLQEAQNQADLKEAELEETTYKPQGKKH